MIVFDMAGTTVDEGNAVYKTLQQALAAAGFELPLSQVLALAAGREKRDAVLSLLQAAGQSPTDEQVDSVYQDFMGRLKRVYAELEVRPAKGAEALMAHLRHRGIAVVLNTGYNRATAEGLLHKLRWTAGVHYDELITADEVRNSRPAPDMIVLAQARLGVADAKSVVKVGDSAVDVEEGKNAGCGYTVGITTGAHSASQLREAQPDFVIDDLSELCGVLGLYTRLGH